MQGRILAAASLCLAAAASPAGIPSFGPVQSVECAGERIDVGSYAAPIFADWDGDGLEDLICGQFDEGRIRFYPNTGVPGQPLFETWSWLMDGLVPLSVPWG